MHDIGRGGGWEQEMKSPDAFLEYRGDSARVTNAELLAPYYSGELAIQSIKERLSLSDEQVRVVHYMLDSFRHPKSPDKLKRKDGSYIAVHSLQLFLSARDFFGIADEKVLDTVLLHDVAEDTQMTLDDVRQALGPERAEFVAAMTEQRDESETEDPLFRKKAVAAFSNQISMAGEVPAAAEVLDRIDDISDLGYLVNKVGPDSSDELRDKIRKALITKFGKCAYTVEAVARGSEGKAQGLAVFFRNLMERQIALLESRGISIGMDEIKNEVLTYKP